VTFLVQNGCRLAEIWEWGIIGSLVQALIALVLLYGCGVWDLVWDLCISKSRWNQLECKSTLCHPSTD
jgi:hypothetical protein